MSLPAEDFDRADERISTVRVLLVDYDPISRHVLSAVLSRAGVFQLAASADRPEQLRQWTADSADVAVLSLAPHQDLATVAREFSGRGLRALLIGTGWTRRQVGNVLAAGATGCIMKNAEVDTLAAAVTAVASGYVVVSPELHRFYAPSADSPPAPRRRVGGSAPAELVRTLTDRENEVLSLLAGGNTTAEVAAKLRVSRATVKSHVSHSLTKLGARNRTEAVLMMHEAIAPR